MVEKKLVYDSQFFVGRIRSPSGAPRGCHRATKQRSRGNTREINNECGKRSHPGTAMSRILVLLLTFAACAEVRSQPSSPNGSKTDELRLSLRSTETSVNVEWTLQDPSVRDFKVTLREGTFIREITYIDPESAPKTDFVDLMPCLTYTVSIQPLDADGNQVGNNKSKSISTLMATPPAATGLSSQNSAENITLTWQRPATACEITAYSIIYSGVAKWGLRTRHSSNATIGREDVNGTTRVTITGLQPYTDYTVTLTASTSKGIGEPTIFNTTTKEAAPTKPNNLEKLQLTANSVSLIWREPNKLKGELKGYEVLCYAGATSRPSEITHHPVHIIGGLSACTEYTVKVAASTAGGKGDPAELTIETPAESPPPVTDFKTQNINLESFTLTWQRPATACEITAYNITYTEVSKTKPRTEMHMDSKYIGRGDAKHATSVVIAGLQPYTEYTVMVTAWTEAKVGTAARIDYVPAGRGTPPKPNVASQQESNSIQIGPSVTLIVSVMLSVHVYKCLQV